MAQSSSVGHGIEDVYRSVINDVINGVKDAFLDENVDIDVLQQLKKVWEEKVNESGAVDLDGTKNIPPPVIRQPARQPSTSSQIHGSQPLVQQIQQQQIQQQVQQVAQHVVLQKQQPQLHVQAGNAVSSHNMPHVSTTIPINVQGQQVMMLRPSVQPFQQVIGSSGQIQFVQQGSQILGQAGLQNVQVIGGGQQLNGPQYALMQGHRMVVFPQGQLNLANLTNPNQASLVRAAAMRFQQSGGSQGGNQNGPHQVHQVDGAGFIDSVSSSRKQDIILAKKDKKKNIVQLDGGPGMTDSSSEEEADDDDEEPLSRYAGLQDDRGDDGDAADEEPLNSGDDQSDEEDLRTLFDSENVVVCQFEKVHRARSKWKFTLKDGIMHLNGKDYCFQKCTGEAEW